MALALKAVGSECMSPAFFTTLELALYLGVSAIKLAQDRSRGVGPPYVRMGRAIRYMRAEVDAWVAEHTTRPKA